MGATIAEDLCQVRDAKDLRSSALSLQARRSDRDLACVHLAVDFANPDTCRVVLGTHLGQRRLSLDAYMTVPLASVAEGASTYGLFSWDDRPRDAYQLGAEVNPRNGTEQSFRVRVGRPGVDALGGSAFDDVPGIHHDHVVAVGEAQPKVVGHENDRHASIGLETADEV